LRPDLQYIIGERAKKLAPLVESEIELMVLTAFDMLSVFTPLTAVIGDDFPDNNRGNILITPQFKWRGYRIDFCVRCDVAPDKLFFVECDGHDFHERTKEQAERDRSKDRAFQAEGIPVLRFTGREIWRDVGAVTSEIINFVGSRLR